MILLRTSGIKNASELVGYNIISTTSSIGKSSERLMADFELVSICL
jgi:hypothetical protein